MIPGEGSLGQSTRWLTADDVAMMRIAQSGVDRDQGTNDDYTVELVFAGIDSDADVIIDFDDTFFAAEPNGRGEGGPTGAQLLTSIDYVITGAELHFNTGTIPGSEFTWHFESAPTSPEIHVDFAYVGNEMGTQPEPYNTLAEGLVFVAGSGTIVLEPGDSSATPVINQAVRLENGNPGTPVRIGVASGSRSVSDRTGFVSRGAQRRSAPR